MKSRYKPLNAAELFCKYFLPKYLTLKNFADNSKISHAELDNFVKYPQYYLGDKIDRQLCNFLDLRPGTFLRVQKYYEIGQYLGEIITTLKNRNI